ncbi:diuretic hormone class 2-like isoform X2 [Microplitis mediator]|uniref:diuretic hormone class 2-like isoform X2 n=1 Tax=Microplitis mediator TaxID=375433 RepID=UPI0025553DD3|nr:diuretic hormone class 2-like isoform X2 [Microplitis mediator]
MYRQLSLAWILLSIAIMIAIFDSVDSAPHVDKLDSTLDNHIFDDSQTKKQITVEEINLNGLQRSKRSYYPNFGIARGYTGSLHGQHLIGKYAANDIYGPGRRR